MANSNNTTMLPSSTSGQTLTQTKHAAIGSLSDEPGTQKTTLQSVSFRAAQSAAAWNRNDEDLRATTTLLQWRDNCRDEIRDEIRAEIQGCGAQDPLLAAWEETFDGATAEELAALRRKVNETREFIDCAIEMVRDLVRLAISEGVKFEGAGNMANAPLQAALRYIDDIEEFADFIDGWTVAEGGAA